MDSIQPTPLYGKRLISQIIDSRAAAPYSRPFCLFPSSPDCTGEFRSISYACVANAINRACWWLEKNLSSGEEKSHVFAYFGPADLRYFGFVVAAMKTGRQVLFASLRNTNEAHLSLFEKTGCRTIVYCESMGRVLQPLFDATEDIRKVEAPSLEEFLAEDLVVHYAFDDDFDAVASRNFVTVHTSGSSGNPKPISYNHRFFAAMDCVNLFPKSQGLTYGTELLNHQTSLSLMPPFHAGGTLYMATGIFQEATLVLCHPNVPVSANHVAQILHAGVANTMMSPPSIIADLARDPVAMKDLIKLDHVAYSGGPLPPDVGQFLAPLLPHLISFIGSTEVALLHGLCGGSELWDSIRFFDDIGYHLDEVSDGMFEFVILNEERTSKYQSVFHVFPGIKEYRTSDLYTSHPTADGWWQYQGRTDDLVVFSNGEKLNPLPMEAIVASNPLVRDVLILGEFRFRPSLLVELVDDYIPKSEAEKQEYLDRIWPTVHEANKIAPAYAKIPKSLICFASSEKPFLRTGKGTVRRKVTIKAYAQELNDLYSSQAAGVLIEGLTVTDSATPEAIKTFVREIYHQALDDAGNLGDDENVFERGLDSLRVLVVSQRLQAVLKHCNAPIDLDDVNPRLIYSAISVNAVCETLLQLIARKSGDQQSDGELVEARQTRIKTMLDKYSEFALRTDPAKVDTRETPWHVILTGSTGSLGTYLLASLQSLPTSKIAKITCLNRAVDGKERQKKANMSRDVESDIDADQRVEFLHADLSQSDLGLGKEKYDELSKTATFVLHNAWQVDFNLTLAAFQAQIQGLKNLLDFAATSSHRAPFMFVSSVSTVTRWLDLHPMDRVPEKLLQEFDASELMGYGESKFVGEHMLDRYSRATNSKSAVLRVGQIAGPVHSKGVWNRQEWFPSLITSSKHLGILPESLGSMDLIDWIPVDDLSSIMVELVNQMVQGGDDSEGQTTVYNLVNPMSTHWSALSPLVQEVAGIKNMVPLKTWVTALDESSRGGNGDIVHINPGLKLLDFYQGLSNGQTSETRTARYDVDRLVEHSETASKLSRITPESMKPWVEQWEL